MGLDGKKSMNNLIQSRERIKIWLKKSRIFWISWERVVDPSMNWTSKGELSWSCPKLDRKLTGEFRRRKKSLKIQERTKPELWTLCKPLLRLKLEPKLKH